MASKILIDHVKVAELYKRGISSYKIADAFGVSQTVILRTLREHNIPIRKPHNQKSALIDIEETIKLHKSGQSIENIATYMGVSPSSVRKRLSENGYDFRIKVSPSIAKIRALEGDKKTKQIQKNIERLETEYLMPKTKKKPKMIKSDKKPYVHTFKKATVSKRYIECEPGVILDEISKKFMVNGKGLMSKISKIKEIKNLNIENGDQVEITIKVTNRLVEQIV